MVILTKRRKFILSSSLLSLGLLSIQMELLPNRYLAIIGLSLLTIPLILWSLKDAVRGPIWFLSWMLPLLFTSGVGFFYFLLPNSFYTSIPVIVFYFLGMYALFLTENIFSVAAIRTIQLYRSSSAVNFLMTLLISFLLYDTILSFRLPFYSTSALVFLISFFFFLHNFWTVNLNEKISLKILIYSIIFSFGVGQTAIAISFWPVTISMGSIFLTSIVYVALGISQAKLNDRLFPKTIREYLSVGLLVFIILIIYTSWG